MGAAPESSAPGPELGEPARLSKRLTLLMAGRLVVATLLIGATLVGAYDEARGFSAPTPRILLSLGGGTFAASLVWAVLLQRTRRVEILAAVEIAFDLVLISGLVWVTGGAASFASFLYGAEVLLAALVIGPRATQATAIAALILYTVVGTGVSNGILPYPGDQPASRFLLDPRDLGVALMSNVVGLVIVAVLANVLSSRLRSARRSAVAAKESAENLARLADDIVRSLSAGLLTTDLEDRVLTVNPAAERMLGGSEAALKGRPVGEILPVGPTTSLRALRRAEGTARRLDGSSFPVGYSEGALYDAARATIGRLVVFQDLTEIQGLRESAARADRLATLGRLSAGLAHEIRNPLSSISGSVELVRESAPLADDDRRLLGIVITEVDRLNNLVSTMLQVARPRPLECVATDLGPIVRDVAQMLGQDSLAERAKLEVVAPAEPVVASVDQDALRQVVWNLGKNALQAARAGGTVRIAVVDAAETVIVEVTDDGSGIPAEVRPRLFETFWSGRSHGVGLGLALVKQLVEAHGGIVAAANNPGGGATFSASFPRRQPQRTSSAPPLMGPAA